MSQSSIANNLNEVYGRIVVIKRTGEDSASFELIDESYTFGRASECDIRIQLTSIAEQHCKIIRNEHGQAMIVKLSDESVSVNNLVMKEESRLLEHNDIFTLVERSFRYEFTPEMLAKAQLASAHVGESPAGTIPLCTETPKKPSSLSASVFSISEVPSSPATPKTPVPVMRAASTAGSNGQSPMVSNLVDSEITTSPKLSPKVFKMDGEMLGGVSHFNIVGASSLGTSVVSSTDNHAVECDKENAMPVENALVADKLTEPVSEPVVERVTEDCAEFVCDTAAIESTCDTTDDTTDNTSETTVETVVETEIVGLTVCDTEAASETLCDTENVMETEIAEAACAAQELECSVAQVCTDAAMESSEATESTEVIESTEATEVAESAEVAEAKEEVSEDVIMTEATEVIEEAVMTESSEVFEDVVMVEATENSEEVNMAESVTETATEEVADSVCENVEMTESSAEATEVVTESVPETTEISTESADIVMEASTVDESPICVVVIESVAEVQCESSQVTVEEMAAVFTILEREATEESASVTDVVVVEESCETEANVTECSETVCDVPVCNETVVNEAVTDETVVNEPVVDESVFTETVCEESVSTESITQETVDTEAVTDEVTVVTEPVTCETTSPAEPPTSEETPTPAENMDAAPVESTSEMPEEVVEASKSAESIVNAYESSPSLSEENSQMEGVEVTGELVEQQAEDIAAPAACEPVESESVAVIVECEGEPESVAVAVECEAEPETPVESAVVEEPTVEIPTVESKDTEAPVDPVVDPVVDSAAETVIAVPMESSESVVESISEPTSESPVEPQSQPQADDNLEVSIEPIEDVFVEIRAGSEEIASVEIITTEPASPVRASADSNESTSTPGPQRKSTRVHVTPKVLESVKRSGGVSSSARQLRSRVAVEPTSPKGRNQKRSSSANGGDEENVDPALSSVDAKKTKVADENTPVRRSARSRVTTQK